MTKIMVKAKKKRAIKSSLFYLREIFRNSLQANRYFASIQNHLYLSRIKRNNQRKNRNMGGYFH